MKAFFLLVFTILFFQNGNSQNVKIELFNKTGFDLDSISFGEKYVGQIKKNSSVVIKESKGFTIQDGHPYGFPKGIIKGEKKDKSSWGLCGTGKENVTTGEFDFDIVLHDNKDGYKLLWSSHNASH